MDTQRLTLSVNEAAQLLGIAPITVRRLIYLGKMPVVRIGRRILIKKSDLDTILRSDIYQKPEAFLQQIREVRN